MEDEPRRTALALSVLMSVRNGMPYLDAAVRSILQQTFSDFEFVIVDNASTDGSTEFIQGIADARIRLVRNSDDLGQSVALNKGLAICRGRWIARMDADDIALPKRFERQLGFLAEHPEAKATSCLAYHIDTRGRSVGKTLPVRPTPENDAVGYLHSGAVIDRELMVSLGGYRPEFRQANDIDLWSRITDHHTIVEQNEYLMEYRVHPGTLSDESYESGRLRHLWARDCMRARRRGLTEPSWEQFLENRRNAPLWRRANRWRKMRAKRCYRQAAQHFLGGARARGALGLLAAAVLQPEYTVPRLVGQLGGRA
jgi:glycosyltransferase involved in cell wall biosynthesis